MEEFIIEKLKKVKELAERGIEGEAQVAKEKLDILLHKYGLTLKDLEKVQLNEYKFKYVTVYERKIMIQCISKVLDNPKLTYSWYKNKKKEFFVEMTEWQFIEASSLIKFHIKQFRKEINERMKAFFSAYCSKHDLFADSAEGDEDIKMTPEEIALWLSAYNSMKDHKIFMKELEKH